MLKIKSRKGFSLIELLVYFSILTIMTSGLITFFWSSYIELGDVLNKNIYLDELNYLFLSVEEKCFKENDWTLDYIKNEVEKIKTCCLKNITDITVNSGDQTFGEKVILKVVFLGKEYEKILFKPF